ncbi:hypothetical protein RvY_18944 [Ramazzottius varieornatus]|uniref:Uncharacterized protein n=1 Tax=Ramazzottius varieornatus TaxID=947166 RepID=A0A1D1W7M7_RAMVA|nr:hypothetical protein RvY_18944 [Ramazzottius varieornatus]
MASSLWKYIKSKVAGQADHGSQLTDLLAFSKGAQHGFPECPVALAFDKQLSLLAMATGLGSVHIFGSSGVALVYQDEKQRAARHLAFVPNQGRLVVIQQDGHISLLELNTSKDGSHTVLENVKTIQSSRVEKVSCAAVVSREASSFLWCGCQDSSIAVFSLPSLEDSADTSFKHWLTSEAERITATTAIDGSQGGEKASEVTMSEGKTSPTPAAHGKVVAIEQHPQKQNLLLVGFADGHIVLYDLEAKVSHRKFLHSGQVMTHVGWQSSADVFNSTYDDGSYLTWNTAQESPLDKPITPYGPYPCMAINKMVVHSSSASDGPLIIFSGGLPKEKRFNDHHSITVQQGERHTALDFPSAVVDFVLLDDGALAVPSDAHTLVVLLENQLIAIDLTSDKYPEIVAPYVTHIHAPITSLELYQEVPHHVMNGLREVGKKPSDIRPFGAYSPKYSHRQWPIHGGSVVPAAAVSADDTTMNSSLQNSLLITAHGDGCLRFWEVLPAGLRLLHKLDAATRYFHVEQEGDFADDSSDVWPPFRKYGFEQETVQEPRMKVEKFCFDVSSQTLLVGGQAGQVLLYKFNPTYAVVHFETINVSLVGEELQYVWRGSQPLLPRAGNLEMFGGFQAVLSVQMDPPSAITALAIHPEWNLLAVGTGHGFALLDYSHRTRIFINCTMKPDGENLENEAHSNGTLQQKARRAGETLRRSLRRIPRPHLNVHSPTSYTVNGGVGENGTIETTKKSSSTEGEVELLDGRQMATSPDGHHNALTNGHTETTQDEVKTHMVVTDKLEVSDANGYTTTVEEKTVVESTGPSQNVTGELAGESLRSTSAIAEPVSLHVQTANVGPIIVDDKLLQALEADIMPAGLEEQEHKAVTEQSRVEKTYNYEATTVRTLLLTSCAIHPTQQGATNVSKGSQPCLWVGLNNGTIYSYALTVPDVSTGSSTDQITAVAAKEIHLRHGAPVIFMAIVDHSKMKVQPESAGSLASSPLPPASPTSLPQSPLSEDVVASPSSNSSVAGAGRPNWKDADKSTQKLLVASEEQIKMFNLPSLKAYGKYKLSNGRFRKVDVLQVGPYKDEYCVVATTNRGDVEVITLPNLKRRQRDNLNKKEDVSAAFGRHGQGIFLSGSQELQLFAVVSGTEHQLPPCFIHLPDGARPAPPVADAPLQGPLEGTVTLQQPATPLPTVGEEAATTNVEEDQVEKVELHEVVQSPVIILQETVVIPVQDEERGRGDGAESQAEVVVMERTTVVSEVPLEAGEMGESATCLLVQEEVVVTSLDDSMLSESQHAVGDISNDSIIDHFHHDLKNGNAEEESGAMNGMKSDFFSEEGGAMKVHSLEDKLKAMEMEEAGANEQKAMGSYIYNETTTTH